MLNAGMVNGAAGCVLHAAFRENFGVLGRFSSFKTTVKYCVFTIITMYRDYFYIIYQCVMERLSFNPSVKRICYN